MTKGLRHFRGQIDALEREIKAELMKGDKLAAKRALKKKKRIEQEVVKTDNQILTLQNHLMNLQNAARAANYIRALKAGNMAINALTNEQTLEEYQATVDEADEAHARVEELNDITGQVIGEGADADDELDDELAKYTAEMAADSEAKMLAPPVAPVAGGTTAVGAGAAAAAAGAGAGAAPIDMSKYSLPAAPSGEVPVPAAAAPAAVPADDDAALLAELDGDLN